MKNVLLFAAFVSFLSVNAQTTDILFLGNSYTYTANLPGMLYSLALAGGDTIYHESNTPGGYTLEGHSTNATSLAKIASRDWDFVVIQEQSQKPSFPPAQVAAETYPYAEILVDSIKSNYECTEPVFFMTWGRKEGDQQNCQFYTPLCTFEGMNARLRESYIEMASDNNATVAPCGAAWQQMSLVDNTFWQGLYSGDGSHPSAKGTYLNACVFYATIFRQTPVGIPYYSNIGQQDAEALQQLAQDIVLDSLDNWYIGHQDVVSNATDSMLGAFLVQFEANSENATDHFWNFGDGNFSSEENPTYQYPNTDFTFEVTHVASSSCGSDTTTLYIELHHLSVSERDELEGVRMIQQGNSLRIQNDANENLIIETFDSAGRLLLTDQIQRNSSTTLDLPSESGIYVVRISNGEQFSIRKCVNP
ncbi:MAG: T9SS type A sorting domain-containing protein [Flavobacteriales bacterium]|nr:T9SS type A sorting domain-containing protein [Flavobacteriales bacterium]